MVQFDLMMHYMKSGIADSASMRDPEMALNLRWLKDNKFSNGKIIVWAANSHITKWTSRAPKYLWTDGHMPLGYEFTSNEEVAKQTYIVGFTSFGGVTGRVNTDRVNIHKPRDGSFERWIDKSSAFSFVDFKKYNQQMPKPDPEDFYMSAYGHLSRKAAWNELFDGIFFIRDIFPCNRTF